MSHPFLDFLNKIAQDDAALRGFFADPDGEATLTAAQKAAVLSGDDAQLKAALIDENPNIQAQAAASALMAEAAHAAAPLIGWNMAALESQIQALKAPAP